MALTSESKLLSTIPEESETQPTLSIGIPVFNRRDLLEQCLKSVLSQNGNRFEVIVSDNGSTDGTKEYLLSLDDPRLRILFQDRNVGMVRNWVSCVNAARGRWFRFLMSDDVLLPGSIERTLICIDRDQRLQCILTNGVVFHSQLELEPGMVVDEAALLKATCRIVHKQRYLTRQKRYRYDWAMPNVLVAHTELLQDVISSPAFGEIVGRLGSTGHTVDYFLVTSTIIRAGLVGRINEPSFGVRIHDANASASYTSDVFFHVVGDGLTNSLLFDYSPSERLYYLEHVFRTSMHWLRAQKIPVGRFRLLIKVWLTVIRLVVGTWDFKALFDRYFKASP